MRGEIVTVPAEKGDPRNLTNTPGANEKSPAWSPDGKSIAFFSDQGGENRLHIAPADGKGQHRVLDAQGAGFYFDLQWSPDGKRMAWRDNSQSIFVMDVATARVRKVASNKIYTPSLTVSFSWSSDSRWLAYTMLPHALVSALYLYDADNDRSTQVTDGLAAVSQPAFDRNGKYLYVLGSTDAGPELDWFAQSNQGLRRTRSIYAIALGKDTPNPFAKESDEEKAQPSQPSQASQPTQPTQPTVVDLEGIEDRIVAFPIPAAASSSCVPVRRARSGISGIPTGNLPSALRRHQAKGRPRHSRSDLRGAHRRREEAALPAGQRLVHDSGRHAEARRRKDRPRQR
jgi:tricorn protease